MCSHNVHVDNFVNIVANRRKTYFSITTGLGGHKSREEDKEGYQALMDLDMADSHDRHYLTLLIWPILLREQFCKKYDPVVSPGKFRLVTELEDVPCMYTPLPREIADMEQIREVCSKLCTGLDQAGLIGFDALSGMIESNRRDLADSVVAVFAHYNIFQPVILQNLFGDKFTRLHTERFAIDIQDGLSSEKTKEAAPPNPAFEMMFQKLATTAFACLEYPKVRNWELPSYDEVQQSLAADEMRSDRDRKSQAMVLAYFAMRVSFVVANTARRVTGAQGAFLPSIQNANLAMGHNNLVERVEKVQAVEDLTALQARAIGYQQVYKGTDHSFGQYVDSSEMPSARRKKNDTTGVAEPRKKRGSASYEYDNRPAKKRGLSFF